MSGPEQAQFPPKKTLRRKPPPDLELQTASQTPISYQHPVSNTYHVSKLHSAHSHASRSGDYVINSYHDADLPPLPETAPPIPPKIPLSDSQPTTSLPYNTVPSSVNIPPVPPRPQHQNLAQSSSFSHAISTVYTPTQPSSAQKYRTAGLASHQVNSNGNNYNQSVTSVQSCGSPTWEPTPNILEDLSYVDESFDETFVSSERPMGPRDLPEYEFLPYPVEDITSNDYDYSTLQPETLQSSPQTHLNHTNQYPDSSFVNYNYQTNTSFDTHNSNLSMEITDSGVDKIDTSSPTLYGSSSPIQMIKKSPDNHRNSPSRSHQKLNPRSRSNSPKKGFYDRSPSLMYRGLSFDEEEEDEYSSRQHSPSRYNYYKSISRTQSNSSGGIYNPFNPETEDDYDYPSTSWTDQAPVWDNYEKDSNNNYIYDDEDNSSDYSNHFDYSILPEIPQSTTTADSSSFSSSPTKRMTLTSTMSFVKKNSLGSLSTSSLDRKRLDHDLPPVPLDLPQLPFASSSLGTSHFQVCSNVWSLSSIFKWCIQLETWLHGEFVSLREFRKSLIKLLVYHRSDIPLDVIGSNVEQIIVSLKSSGAIQISEGIPTATSSSEKNLKKSSKLEKGVNFKEKAKVSGILSELLPCYCRDSDHKLLGDNSTKLRCFSSQCYLNKVIEHEIVMKNTNILDIKLSEDWATYWKLTAEDLRKYPKTVLKRQSLIYDLFKSEDVFVRRGSCFVEFVGPEFVKFITSFIGERSIVSINKFEDDVINPGKSLVKIHRKSLLEPLLKIMVADGRFVKSVTHIGDIYYQWSELIKDSLLQYICTLPMIEDLMKLPKVKDWIDGLRNFRRVKELKTNGALLFISTFNSRYQHLPLQLSDIRSFYDPEDEEFISLTRAIDGIRRLGKNLNEMKSHADNIFELKKVQKQLLWKNQSSSFISWGSPNRKVFYRGDVIRKGDLKINSYNNHLVLLDNYLLITEKVKTAKSSLLSYKVIEIPIPVELILVEIKESSGDESSVKISNEISVNANNDNSKAMMETSNVSGDEDDSIFSFKLRFAGRGKHYAYVFSTKSERERRSWILAFIKAKTNLFTRLNRVAPYDISTVANSTFAYDFNSRIVKLQVCAPKDPLEASATDSLNTMQRIKCQNIYSFENSKYRFIFGKVLNLVSFVFNKVKFYFIGSTTGMYCSDLKNGWKKMFNGPDVSKIEVDVNLNLVVVLANKNLKYFLLNSVIGVYYDKKEKLTGISLSNEPVSFFEFGKHRQIRMLFYAKKKGNSAVTNFKVMIPEIDNDGVFSSFKVAKKFYVQADCFGLSIFNTSFAVLTTKGIEVLELNKLLPRSIPEFSSSGDRKDGYGRKSIESSSSTMSINSGVEIIRKMINSGSVKPMGMYKLNNNSEFLLAYNNCAIFTNKHGKLSRNSILRFDFKAKKIAFVQNNLFIACEEVLEIWSISDFVHGTNQLIQVITGKDLSIISDGSEISISVANPKVPGLQLILDLESRSESLESSIG